MAKATKGKSMALKLSKPQRDILLLAVQAAIDGTYLELSKIQIRSLQVICAKIKVEEDQARSRSRSRRLSRVQADNMLAEAAMRQGIWVNRLNP